ncbi:alpha/beta hydrolase fold domain-containing protein [Niveispirillum sp. KHB5.9]|uniref:alpha/beta hydrolase fold domain-containing protein n=1 Tax=Niveispirillum sp. KHB5.9 TaxID=3400269 RepID=UPI003A886AE9
MRPESLVFGAHPGGDLVGDLWCPDGLGPHPVLVAVPGGAWLRGDKAALGSWGRYLATRGIALFAIDYRRAVAGPVFPGNAQDVRAALCFIAGKAEELRLDGDRIALLGASAGAHLAALVALAGDRAPVKADGDASLPSLRALVGIYGVYDLFSHWQADLAGNAGPGKDAAARMLGADPYDDPGLYADASPLRQVRRVGNGLPVLLAWGTHDSDVLPGQSEGMLTALRQAGFPVRGRPVLGATHFWFSEQDPAEEGGFSAQLAPDLLRFLRLHLVGGR